MLNSPTFPSQASTSPRHNRSPKQYSRQQHYNLPTPQLLVPYRRAPSLLSSHTPSPHPNSQNQIQHHNSTKITTQHKQIDSKRSPFSQITSTYSLASQIFNNFTKRKRQTQNFLEEIFPAFSQITLSTRTLFTQITLSHKTHKPTLKHNTLSFPRALSHTLSFS